MDEAVKKWFLKACNDLRAAEELLKLSEPLTDIVCFHAQQAVEKLLKGFLTYHGIKIPRTHDISILLEMCIEIDKGFKKLDIETLEKLSFYAVEIRYPGELYIPSLQEAREAVEIAKNLRTFIFEKLGAIGK